jgi:hypothetical protein
MGSLALFFPSSEIHHIPLLECNWKANLLSKLKVPSNPQYVSDKINKRKTPCNHQVQAQVGIEKEEIQSSLLKC